MIQRIQTIYLLLAIIAAAFLIFIPLGSFIVAGNEATLFSTAVESGQVQVSLMPPVWSLGIALALGIALRVFAIFDFNQRKRQLHLCRSALLADLCFCVFYCLIAFRMESETNFTFSPWLLLLLIGVVFTILAIRGIRHDERLVRAADRLR